MHECKKVQLHISSYTEQKLYNVTKMSSRPYSAPNIKHTCTCISVIVSSIWRHPDFGVMRIEGSQSGHHHQSTHRMTGMSMHVPNMKFMMCTVYNHCTRMLHMDRQKSYLTKTIVWECQQNNRPYYRST